MMKEHEIIQVARECLGIEALNELQNKVLSAWKSQENSDLVIYSPTGTGKTLAFAMCLLEGLQPTRGELQAVVIAPSRELVIQTAEIIRSLAQGYKVTPCYGGHNSSDERASLSVTPDVIVATPGRLLDHQRRGNIDVSAARLLVLDEFDKSLELGFEDDMRQLLRPMHRLKRRVLASATVLDPVPDYVRLHQPHIINTLVTDNGPASRIDVWLMESDQQDKIDALVRLLNNIDDGKVIVFTNFRESAECLHDTLSQQGIVAGLYHGAMDQQEREMSVAMLNNGSVNILIATDLASRGLDINQVEHIIHYHMPVNEQAWVHRNGRTARVNASGNVYLIHQDSTPLPDYVTDCKPFTTHAGSSSPEPMMATLYFQAGKKEKMSRGDIVGFIVKNSDIDASAVGHIDVRDHYSLAAIPRNKAHSVLMLLQSLKIKGKKVRISLLNPSR